MTLAAFVKIENVGEITKPKIDSLSIVLSTVGFGGLIYGLASMAGAPFTAPVVWAPLLGRYYRPCIIWTSPKFNG